MRSLFWLDAGLSEGRSGQSRESLRRASSRLWISAGRREFKPASFHVDALAHKLNALHLQPQSLIHPRFAWKQDPSALTHHTLPGQMLRTWAPQSPSHLTCSTRISGGSGDLAIGRSPAARNSKNKPPDVLEITHSCDSLIGIGIAIAIGCRMVEKPIPDSDPDVFRMWRSLADSWELFTAEHIHDPGRANSASHGYQARIVIFNRADNARLLAQGMRAQLL